MSNEFLVSVADVILRDPTTGNGLAYGKTNITSAFTLSTAQTDVRGGINNPLLFTYIHDRNLEIRVEQAVFDSTILALNAGQLVSTGAVNVLQTDCIVLSASGSGTLTATPIGNVSVFLDDGSIQTVTPTGSNITVSSGANEKVDAVYVTSTTADQLTIETLEPPSVVDLTLLAEVRDNTGEVVKRLQINVPRFQVMGNYTLSLAANGVSNQALEGRALAVVSTDCTTNDYYAKVTWIPVTSGTAAISSIAAVPSTMTFSAATLPSSQNISVLGIRGGVYSNINITTSCSYVKLTGGSVISVNATTGSVIVTAAASGSSGTIGVNYSSASLVDYVTVYIGA